MIAPVPVHCFSITFTYFVTIITVDEIESRKNVGVDEMVIDEMGSRRSGDNPTNVHINMYMYLNIFDI